MRYIFTFLLGVLSTIAMAQQVPATFQDKEKKPVLVPANSAPVPVFSSDAKNRQTTLPSSTFAPIPGTPGDHIDVGSQQASASYKVTYDPSSGMPIWIEGNVPESSPVTPEAITEAAWQQLEAMAPLLPFTNIRTELVVQKATFDAFNIAHATFSQQYQGVPVRNREIHVHLYPGGKVVVNGQMARMAATLAPTPTIEAFTAGQLALADVSQHHPVVTFTPEQEQFLDYTGPQTRLVWYDLPGTIREQRLAWEITTRPTFMHRWEYVIDAHSGDILLEYDHTCAIGPTTATGTNLNGNSRTVQVFQAQNGVYYLLDAAKSMYTGPNTTLPNAGDGFIITADWQNNPPSNANYAEITSNNNTWSALHISAHDNSAISYNYFESTFGHKSINAQGGDIISFVNVADDDGLGLDNAFWNGTAMFYGNGRQAFKPLAGALDVAGHEMSHGVVQATANLEYQGESGALNESFADIFGAMIDRDDWLLGEDVVKTQFFPSGALRSMSDPHNGGNSLNDNGYQPKHMNEKYTGTQDNGGVHINSGIVNHAFYLFATATTKSKAEQVYYRALAQYLTRSSKFLDSRLAVVQAATDLYGANSAEVNAAKSAFNQVGILDGQGGNYDPTIPTNTGQQYIVSTDINPSDPNTLYLSSTTGTNYQALSTTAQKRRISITDNGAVGYFVDNTNNMRGILIDPTAPGEKALTTDGFWDNVAVSKDGNRLAAISTEIDTAIWIYDFTLQLWGKYTLYNPTYTQGINTGEVLYADAITWDHTGEYVMYDAFNRISSFAGDDIEYWDVGIIRVWNKAANYFGDGQVTKIFTNLDQGESVGNAVFSTNSPNVIAFDYINANTGDFAVLAANIETGAVGSIFEQGVLGVPAFSSADDKMIFNANDTNGDAVIGVINLAPSKVNIASGAQAALLIPDAKWGLWIAKGDRVISLGREEELSGVLISAYPNPMQDQLTVEIDDLPAGGGQISIYDLTGRVLNSQTWSAQQQGSASWRFETEQWPAGIYILELRTMQGRKVMRVQK